MPTSVRASNRLHGHGIEHGIPNAFSIEDSTCRISRFLCQAGERDEVNKLRILAVSDSETDHVELGRILARLQWRVDRAYSRAQAIHMMRRTPVGVIVCDRDLPDGSWKDILNESAIERNPPCVIVTTKISNDAGLWSEVLHLGGYEVLAKPFDPHEVFHSISMGWRHWQQAELPLKGEHAVAAAA
jgi:DNA-binding response OmpR family regulator